MKKPSKQNPHNCQTVFQVLRRNYFRGKLFLAAQTQNFGMSLDLRKNSDLQNSKTFGSNIIDLNSNIGFFRVPVLDWNQKLGFGEALWIFEIQKLSQKVPEIFASCI
eukprot:TRINITY_DN17207_c0_g1_i3.p5 TRINITY_DN17207_c0_g1~~TRINITY_DN17207_c0_g1_i3.p5  ORF type:complete len:107 (+),score=9.49 TRINITY_DN17207_c0_g1_i3:511-831(+)